MKLSSLVTYLLVYTEVAPHKQRSFLPVSSVLRVVYATEINMFFICKRDKRFKYSENGRNKVLHSVA